MDLPGAALLRVLNGQSRPVGVAFLVDTGSGTRVVTCSHVLTGDPEFWTFDGSHRVGADIVEVDSADDIALLRPHGLPADTATLKVIATDEWDRPVRCFGFPAGHDDGVWATGRLLGRQGGGLVMVGDDRTSGFAIEPGFSGGPAWDPELGGVLGMVVSVAGKASRRTAFLVPGATLLERWQAPAPRSPYRGLKSFREEDAELFYGRDDVAAAIAAKVVQEPVVALVGPSGRGKSSLIFAGVIPRLRAQDLTIVPVRPRGDMLGALSGALLDLLEPDLSETARLTDRPKLAEVIAGGRIGEVVTRVLDKTGTAELLIVVDQLEEALVQDDSVAVLGDLADAPLKILLAIRSDFLDRALDHPALATVLRSCDTIGAMTRDQVKAAITGPLPPDVRMEGDLAARIVDDVAHAPGQLPLLQFALDKLWDKQSNGVLTHAAYDELGGVGGALARYAEQEVWSQLSDGERQVAPGLFGRLVRTDPDLPPTRRPVRTADLTDDEKALAQRLVTAGLLVTGRRDTVELAHEALITHWDRLRGSVEEDRDFQLWLEVLRQDMAEWTARPQSLSKFRTLPSGTDAARWLRERSDHLPGEAGFARQILAVRRRHSRRWYRRGFFVLLLVAVVLYSFTDLPERLGIQIGGSNLAERLVTGLEVGEDADTTNLLKVLAAYRTDPTNRVVEKLYAAHRTVELGDRLISHPDRGTVFDEVVVSGDGRVLVTKSKTGTLVWSDGRPTRLDVTAASDIAVDVDGTLIAVANGDNVHLYTRSGEARRQFTVPGGTSRPMRIAVTGDMVATWRQHDERIGLWGLDGRMIGERAAEAADDLKMWFAGDTLVTLANGRLRWSEPSGRSSVLREGVVVAAARGSNVVTCRHDEDAVIETFRLPELAVVYSKRLENGRCYEALALDPTGRYLAMFAGSGLLVDLDKRNSAAYFDVRGTMKALVTTPDGQLRAVGLQSSTMAEHRIVLNSLPYAPITTPRTGAISHKDFQVATIHSIEPRQWLLGLWHGDDQRLIASAPLSGEPGAVWFDPVDAHVIVAYRDRPDLEVRRLPQLNVTAAIAPGGQATVRFDDQGRLLTGTNGKIRSWDVGSGAELAPAAAVVGPAFTGGPLPFDVLGKGRVVVVSPDAHGLDEWDLVSGGRVPLHNLVGNKIVAVKATARPGVFMLLRAKGKDQFEVTLGDRQLVSDTSADDRALHRLVEARADHLVGALGGVVTWDYDGVDIGPNIGSGRTMIALRGAKVLTGKGLLSLDPEDWARHLCAVIGNQDLREDIPGVKTTGLCPR